MLILVLDTPIKIIFRIISTMSTTTESKEEKKVMEIVASLDEDVDDKKVKTDSKGAIKPVDVPWTTVDMEDRPLKLEVMKKAEDKMVDGKKVVGKMEVIATYETTKKASFPSQLVRTALDGEPNAAEIPILNSAAKPKVMGYLMSYLTRKNGNDTPIIEKPLRSKVMKDVCKHDPLDADFIDEVGVSKQDLYDLILMANYMDLKCLLHLGCAKVASMIKGKPLEEIKSILSTGEVKDDKKTAEKPSA